VRLIGWDDPIDPIFQGVGTMGELWEIGAVPGGLRTPFACGRGAARLVLHRDRPFFMYDSLRQIQWSLYYCSTRL
jgi:hypothetical protein